LSSSSTVVSDHSRSLSSSGSTVQTINLKATKPKLSDKRPHRVSRQIGFTPSSCLSNRRPKSSATNQFALEHLRRGRRQCCTCTLRFASTSDVRSTWLLESFRSLDSRHLITRLDRHPHIFSCASLSFTHKTRPGHAISTTCLLRYESIFHYHTHHPTCQSVHLALSALSLSLSLESAESHSTLQTRVSLAKESNFNCPLNLIRHIHTISRRFHFDSYSNTCRSRSAAALCRPSLFQLFPSLNFTVTRNILHSHVSRQVDSFALSLSLSLARLLTLQ
jgi:hypothetical protein